MIDLSDTILTAVYGLAATLALAFATWVASFIKRDVSIVDSVWSLLIALAGFVYAATLPATGPRTILVLALAGMWAARLAGYITRRNHGQPEDHRYRAIRARNEPNFEWKSLYLVFGLQAVLAWIVSLPLLAAFEDPRPLNALDALGIAVVVCGLAFEAIGDWQLARFKGDRKSVV